MACRNDGRCDSTLLKGQVKLRNGSIVAVTPKVEDPKTNRENGVALARH
jgi:hypothetical protein